MNKTDEFILESHVGIISNFCEKNKCCISFRRAGKHTLDRLKEGSPCKGHEILEKSIKEKTVVGMGEFDSELFKKIGNLYGLIGHWEDYTHNKQTKKKITGVYISKYAISVARDESLWGNSDEEKEFFKMLKEWFFVNENGSFSNASDSSVQEGLKDPWIPITADNAVMKMLDSLVKTKSNIAPYFLTGDYDIHDIFKTEGGKLIQCNDIKEEEILNSLNIELLKADELSRKTYQEHGGKAGSKEANCLDKNEFNYIRHGAQINYPIHMLQHEPGKKLVRSVIEADYDVAFCDTKGEWTVTSWENGKYDLSKAKPNFEQWYVDHNVIMKSTFSQTAEGNLVIFRLEMKNMSSFEQISRGIDLFWKEEALKEVCSNASEFKLYNQLKSFLTRIDSDEKNENKSDENKIKAKVKIKLYNYIRKIEKTATEYSSGIFELNALIVECHKYMQGKVIENKRD